jgi:LDH2 family malate/lactate/ureidoglycolate dehydrogenase
MMVEVLSALLAGMPMDHELSHLYAPPYDEPRRVAHLFIAFDLPAFGDPDGFRQRLSRLMGLVREQPAAPMAGDERVVVPGDPESVTAAERRQHGIPLSEGEWAWFEAVEREGGREGAPAG